MPQARQFSSRAILILSEFIDFKSNNMRVFVNNLSFNPMRYLIASVASINPPMPGVTPNTGRGEDEGGGGSLKIHL